MVSGGGAAGAGADEVHVVLPIVLLFAVWRRWRLVGGFAAGGVGVGLVCLAVAGVGGMRNYVAAMVAAAATGAVGTAADGYQVFSSKMPNLRGLFYAVAGRRSGVRWRWGLRR